MRCSQTPVKMSCFAQLTATLGHVPAELLRLIDAYARQTRFLYVVGGQSHSWHNQVTVVVYDPKADTWLHVKTVDQTGKEVESVPVEAEVYATTDRGVHLYPVNTTLHLGVFDPKTAHGPPNANGATPSQQGGEQGALLVPGAPSNPLFHPNLRCRLNIDSRRCVVTAGSWLYTVINGACVSIHRQTEEKHTEASVQQLTQAIAVYGKWLITSDSTGFIHARRLDGDGKVVEAPQRGVFPPLTRRVRKLVVPSDAPPHVRARFPNGRTKAEDVVLPHDFRHHFVVVGESLYALQLYDTEGDVTMVMNQLLEGHTSYMSKYEVTNVLLRYRHGHGPEAWEVCAPLPARWRFAPVPW